MFITSRSLVGLQVAPQNPPFAIAEPFLHHLVAADRVLPNVARHVSPIGAVVEKHIASARAQQAAQRVDRCLALGRHGGQRLTLGSIVVPRFDAALGGHRHALLAQPAVTAKSPRAGSSDPPPALVVSPIALNQVADCRFPHHGFSPGA
ncbi:MAG TPA: hypothetical protein VFW73_06495 [Lacipirellulaceae bacterium]|nr:hypothetical protein [Lacipirellulaceae bacterium]